MSYLFHLNVSLNYIAGIINLFISSYVTYITCPGALAILQRRHLASGCDCFLRRGCGEGASYSFSLWSLHVGLALPRRPLGESR